MNAIDAKITELQEYCEEQRAYIQKSFAFIGEIANQDESTFEKLNTIQNICTNIENHHALIRSAQITINILETLKEK